MKELAKYNIQIQSLDEKTYEYDFVGNSAFFAAFQQDLIQNGHFSAKVKLEKSATMVQTRFEISGEVGLICDRSLEAFDEPFHVKERYIYKFGEIAQELTDEIEVIPFGTAVINVAQPIYEFIALTIPMKKLHPRFRIDDDDDSDEILVYSTDNQEVIDLENTKEENIDPRWAALQKLKNI